jgi:hypothetical protein
LKRSPRRKPNANAGDAAGCRHTYEATARTVTTQVIAEGRDTEIVTYGPDRVLRRPKRPRALDGEAMVMRWVLDHGYPCPRVFEVRSVHDLPPTGPHARRRRARPRRRCSPR